MPFKNHGEITYKKGETLERYLSIKHKKQRCYQVEELQEAAQKNAITVETTSIKSKSVISKSSIFKDETFLR